MVFLGPHFPFLWCREIMCYDCTHLYARNLLLGNTFFTFHNLSECLLGT